MIRQCIVITIHLISIYVAKSDPAHQEETTVYAIDAAGGGSGLSPPLASPARREETQHHQLKEPDDDSWNGYENDDEHKIDEAHRMHLLHLMTSGGGGGGAPAAAAATEVVAYFQDFLKGYDRRIRAELEEKIELSAEERINALRDSHRQEIEELYRQQLVNAEECERDWQLERKMVVDAALFLEGQAVQALEDVQQLHRELEAAAEKERLMLTNVSAMRTTWHGERQVTIDTASILERKTKAALENIRRLQREIDSAAEREERWLREKKIILESVSAIGDKFKQYDAAVVDEKKYWKLERDQLLVGVERLRAEMVQLRKETSDITESMLKLLQEKNASVTDVNATTTTFEDVELLETAKMELEQEKTKLQKKYASLKMENTILKSKQSQVAIEEEVLKRVAAKMEDAEATAQLKLNDEVNRQLDEARIEWRKSTKDKLQEQEKLHEKEVEGLKALHKKEITEEIQRLQEGLNATVEEEVFKGLISHIKKIEHDVGLQWKADVEELTRHLRDAEMSTELVRVGARRMAKDRLKETERHMKELGDLRAAHREEVKKLQEDLVAAREKQEKLKDERKTMVDSALLLESTLKQSRMNADFFEKAFEHCSDEIERREEVIRSMQRGKCKPLDAHVNRIEHEIELKWHADIRELTVLHKVNLEEAEKKLEMVRVGISQRAQKQLMRAAEMHGNEVKTLKTSHEEELRRILTEVEAAGDNVKRWEEEKKSIIDSATLLESRAKQIQSDVQFWQESFNKRSHFNFTYIEEGAGGYILVAAGPRGDSVLTFYERALRPFVRWALKLFRHLSAAAALVLEKLNSCPRALARREGQPPGVVIAIERTCDDPQHASEAFTVALGLLLSFFVVLVRPTITLLDKIICYIIGYQLEPESSKTAVKEVDEKTKKSTKVVKKKGQKRS